MVNCDSSSEGKSEGQQDVISNMGCGPAEFPAVFHLAHLTARATLLDELLVQATLGLDTGLCKDRVHVYT